MKKLGTAIFLLFIVALATPVFAEQQIYTIEEGKSLVLTFQNPTNTTMTIKIQNLDYPADKVPLWISPTTVPANSTVSVIVHFYITNDGVSPGTYAVALYTDYQSYLIYLKKTSGNTQTNNADLKKVYEQINNLQSSIKQLTNFYDERYNNLYSQLQTLKKSKIEDERQISQMEQELKLIKNQLDQINKQLDTMNKLILEMQKTVQTDDKQVATFNMKLKQYDKLLAEYDKKISVINAAMKQIDIDKYKQLDQRVATLEKKQTAMEQAVSDAKSMASQSYGQVNLLTAKVNDAENKINYALIAGLTGVVALVMIFSNGNIPFKNNGSKRNGGLPRKRYADNIVPPGVSPKATTELEKISLTKEELKELLEKAKAEGQAEAMAKLVKALEEAEGGGDE